MAVGPRELQPRGRLARQGSDQPPIRRGPGLCTADLSLPGRDAALATTARPSAPRGGRLRDPPADVPSRRRPARGGGRAPRGALGVGRADGPGGRPPSRMRSRACAASATRSRSRQAPLLCTWRMLGVGVEPGRRGRGGHDDLRGQLPMRSPTPARRPTSWTCCEEDGNLDPGPARRDADARLAAEGRRVGAVMAVDLLGKAADLTSDQRSLCRSTRSRSSRTPPSRSAPPTRAVPQAPGVAWPPCPSTATR